MLAEIIVVDFNPLVYERLLKLGVRVAYGDITQRDVLHHAGVSHVEIIICSLPNMVLKGANNMKLLRQLRELNPAAKIVVHAELLSDIPALYKAGASYVSVPRLLEAADLLHVIAAAETDKLTDKLNAQAELLKTRNEVIA
jgi:voltage-gated potassium channel Kch